jgi:hypothetical protein
MDLFTVNELGELIRNESSPCVSIYMPTHRTGREIREDVLRCKNLLQRAEAGLLERGSRTSEAKKLLEPCETLQLDSEFWKHQSEGLAMFVAPGLFRSFRVSLPFDETVVVEGRFHIKPILPLLQGDGQFYLLAVSLNHVRLFSGTRHTVTELTPADLPTSLAEALRVDEYKQYVQLHTHRASAGMAASQGDVMYHGQGGSAGEVKKKDEISQYFRTLDRALQETLNRNKAPLVFAGVDYLFPLFRSVSRNGDIIDQPVTGNPDEMNARQLHAKAWSVVEPRFQQAREQVVAAYRQQIGTGLASHQAETILRAAHQGAVASLLIARGRELWGQVDQQGTLLERHDQRQPDDEDLVDHAAVHTLLNSGSVFSLPPEEMPDEAPLAAVFRHPTF